MEVGKKSQNNEFLKIIMIRKMKKIFKNKKIEIEKKN